MKKQILLLLASLMLTTGLFCQQGTYQITEATNLEGKPYTGTVTFTPGDNTVKVQWETSVGETYGGIGIQRENDLWVGWGVGANYGIAVYEFQEADLVGIWAGSDGALGTETIIEGASVGLGGRFDIFGNNPDGSEYEGSISIEKFGNTYQLNWNSGGFRYDGVGIREGNLLIVGWAYGASAGVISYDFDGTKATGKWSVVGAENLATESIQQ